MPEYIEREALIKAGRAIKLKDIYPDWNVPKVAKALEQQGQTFLKLIKEAPTADVVEVVRCKDCMKCDIRYPLKEIGKEAVIGYFCEMLNIYKSPTDFCSYGKRKEGAGE